MALTEIDASAAGERFEFGAQRPGVEFVSDLVGVAHERFGVRAIAA